MSAVPVERARRPLRDLDSQLLTVLLWLRLVLALHACILGIYSLPFSPHRIGMMLACVALTVWTLVAGRLFQRFPTSPWPVVADLIMTLGIIGLTGPLREVQYTGVGMTLAGYWIAGAPLATAMRYGWAGGLGASLVLCSTAWALNPRPDIDSAGSVLVVVVSCTGMGYLVTGMRTSLADRDVYYATAAALGERERLSRIVHDGVLQVLAMVEREGNALGPRGRQLAHEAREQEIALRALLQDKDVDVTVGDVVDTDLRSLTGALDRHESDKVSISVLADDVRLPASVVDEVDAIVAEVLKNVAKHAGSGAMAYLLLEEEDDALVLSIRDNGVGADREQILSAGRRGRLGVQDSICGRIRDLGGEATLKAAPGRGVEWEFRIPREQ